MRFWRGDGDFEVGVLHAGLSVFVKRVQRVVLVIFGTAVPFQFHSNSQVRCFRGWRKESNHTFGGRGEGTRRERERETFHVENV